MKKIGILGGGQLGRMFIQNALNYPIEVHILDPDTNCSCHSISDNFVQGSFNDYQTVIDFGQGVDIIGIEIEHVNTEALKELKRQGKIVIPCPDTLEIFQDKGIQKKFYEENKLPTAPFYLIDSEEEVNESKIKYPFVQKLRKGGYDGKGVQLIKDKTEISKLWNEPSVIEECAAIEKELAVIFVKNGKGEIAIFPTVEMVFDDKLNLVDYLFSPANINEKVTSEINQIIGDFSKKIQSSGIFAVELFLNKNGSIWINETAPRVHNSGHATIEGNFSSQYDMMLRSLLNLPFPSVDSISFSAMLNLIGEENHTGVAKVENIEELVKLNQTYIHWYGKKITKPGRKMGHITFIGENIEELKEKVNFAKGNIKVVS